MIAILGRSVPTAAAGIADTPLPQFADGKQSKLLMVVPGVVKRNRLQTDFLCTSLDSDPVNIGVEIFGPDGTLRNSISAGVGAMTDVGSGQTVTIGTGGTATYLESTVIPLAAVSQGSARLVATSERVRCTVSVVDDAVSPPVSLATLVEGARPVLGPELATHSLPRFSDGQQATHALVFPGIIKRVRVQTDFFCTSLARENVDVGVELFGPDGTLQNSISEGNGALVNVAPGSTVTFGTTGSAAFLETAIILTSGVAQGVARVVSTSPDLACAAMVLDSAVTPPTAMSGLFAESQGLPGDVNRDGSVNSADIPALIREIFR